MTEAVTTGTVEVPDRDRLEVLAVLDWELATLGDPLADLSYLLIGWVTEPEGRSGVKWLTGPTTGIPTIEDMVARYCAATRRARSTHPRRRPSRRSRRARRP